MVTYARNEKVFITIPCWPCTLLPGKQKNLRSFLAYSKWDKHRGEPTSLKHSAALSFHNILNTCLLPPVEYGTLFVVRATTEDERLLYVLILTVSTFHLCLEFGNRSWIWKHTQTLYFLWGNQKLSLCPWLRSPLFSKHRKTPYSNKHLLAWCSGLPWPCAAAVARAVQAADCRACVLM